MGGKLFIPNIKRYASKPIALFGLINIFVRVCFLARENHQAHVQIYSDCKEEAFLYLATNCYVYTPNYQKLASSSHC